MKRRTIIIALIVAVAAISAIWLVTRDSDHASSIRIAINIPLSGPVASFSGQWANGLRMGIDDACRDLGIERETFTIDAQDNAASPPQAISILQKHKLRGYDVYVSGVSQMSTAVAKEVDREPVVHLLVSYDSRLAAQGSNRMRILPSFKIEGPMYPKYAAMRSAKRVHAFILNNPEINEQFMTYVQPEVERAGMEYSQDIYDFGFTDFNTLVATAKAKTPDLVFVSGFSIHVLPIIRALRAQGMVGDGNVLCIMDFNELLYNNTPQSDLKDIVFIAPTFALPGEPATADDWSARYSDLFGVVPTFIPGYAYDTGRILVATYKEKRSVSREAIESQLPYEGICGTISIDGDGDLSTPLRFLRVAEGGQLLPVD